MSFFENLGHRFKDGFHAAFISAAQQPPADFNNASSKRNGIPIFQGTPLIAQVPEDHAAPRYEANLLVTTDPSHSEKAKLEVKRLWPGKIGDFSVTTHYFPLTNEIGPGALNSWNTDLNFAAHLVAQKLKSISPERWSATQEKPIIRRKTKLDL